VNYKTFCIQDNIGYRQIKADGTIFDKFYQINNPQRREIVAIPDGCIDIQFVWDGDGCRAYVCGSFLEGGPSPVSSSRRCFGVKFRSGVVPAFLRGSVEEITGNRYKLDNYIAVERLQGALREDDTLERKAESFLREFRLSFLRPHAITRHVLKAVEDHSGCLSISELIDALGYSHRYTGRVFKSHVGMPIKKYADIIRLQEAIEIIQAGREEELYHRLGYYDQAHFIHAFKRFTSLTPKSYLRSQRIAIV
jgi:AraC-like DNA-binding protein